MPDVLVQDDGTGHQGFVAAPTVLVGTETEQGGYYKGDEDPADTPAILAVLEPGDHWVDTTGGVPYQHKDRNGANDGWNISAIVKKAANGDITGRVEIDADDNVVMSSVVNFVDSTISITADGAVQMNMGALTIGIIADGTITLAGLNATLNIDGATGTFNFGGPVVFGGLPTVNPADGSLWSDAGVVKVSS